MGRKTEANRLAHKKKIDTKKLKKQEAEHLRKEKMKLIYELNKENNAKKED